MSDVIEWVLELRVQEGQGDKVRPLLEEMVAATERDEPGALTYEYYMPEEGGTCTVLERYADSAAAMTHLGNFGAHFADRFLACFAPERFTVYGPADAALREALAGFGATHQARVAGFSRQH
jgi:quinol monooxygenase YgiN